MTITPIRDQIIDILIERRHSTEQRADLILTAVADWMTSEGHDFRLGLALAEAAPDKFEFGVHGDAELADVSMSVAAELAKLLRAELPTPEQAERPALADRYATLAGGEA